MEAKKSAAQLGTTHVAELMFSKTASSLAASELKKLERTLSEAQKKEKIDHLTLVVWADSARPVDKQADLPKQEVQLAADRADELKGHLATLNPNWRVLVVNMAKHPGRIKRLLKTETARVQESLETAPASSQKKASRAFVIVSVRN